ncbi:hypothetical protein [Microbulbifer aggregans]|uniref:hypothetical protein n=1 Tax=Microbulbifer aggregans TaxID=1769779 RepID=UPI001CFE0A71|nr:hypothetical protein [Microbulbifer aggregans]
MQEAELTEPETGQDARATRRVKIAPPPKSAPRPGLTAEPRPKAPTGSASNLKLAAPKRDLARLSCGCRNPRQLHRWLQHSLPQNISADTAQRRAATLRSLLNEVSRWQAEASLRLACLETLRPVIIELGDSLAFTQEPQQPQGSHQPQEVRRAVNTACILYQHLAQAYTGVCVELANLSGSPLGRRRLRQALHRASDSLRRLLRTCCHFNFATPKHTWTRLQLLLQLARKQGVSRDRVFDPLARKQPGANRLGFERLDTPYLHCALFASANPLQLTASEQQDLWHLCGHWATRATTLDRHLSGSRVLLANLKLDQAPIPAMRLHNAGVDPQHFSLPHGWSIDLSGPLQQLQRRIQRPRAVSPDLLQRVQNLWSGDQGRGGRRTPVNIRCEVVIGITAICHHLNHGSTATAETGMTLGTPASGEQQLVMEVGAVDFHSGTTLRDYEVTLPSAPTTRGDSQRRSQGRYQSIPCTLLNTSSGGAGLRLPPEVQGKLRSGDLIGITIAGRWEVALVRWQYALPDHCRIGVELLGGQTSAVRVHRHTRDGRRTDSISALLTGDCGRAPELVLPIPLFQPGDTIDVVAARQARCVTLYNQTACTGSFAMFDFS